MTLEPDWVTENEAIAIHDWTLAEHGGKPGFRDKSLLDAAMVAARNHFAHERAPLFRLAAVYAHGINRNHAFVDGNKRVALIVSATFLELNGFRLTASESDALSVMNAIADTNDSPSLDEIESWFQGNSEPLDPAEIPPPQK